MNPVALIAIVLTAFLGIKVGSLLDGRWPAALLGGALFGLIAFLLVT